MRIKHVIFEGAAGVSAGHTDEADDKQQAKLGTYVGLTLSAETVKSLSFFCQDHQIPNPAAADVYHVTLLSSKKYLEDYTAPGILTRPYVGYNMESAIWDTKSGERALVVKFECPELIQHHEDLMNEHEAEYEYDEYVPHITLSYDIGEEWKPNLAKLDYALNKYVETIILVEEYEEALEVDWNKKDKKNDK